MGAILLRVETRRRVWNFLRGIAPSDYLSITGLIIATITLAVDYDNIPGALIIVYGLYILVLAAFLVWREYVYSRKARYAEANLTFHDGPRYLRDALDVIKAGDRDYARRLVRDALIAFADGFGVITGANCRACIKEIAADPNSQDDKAKFYVQTFLRSNKTEVGKVPDDKPSLIRDNSDFLAIFSHKTDCFFSNDLSNEPYYQNSNWDDDAESRKKMLTRQEYSYISAVVWPIMGAALGAEKPVIVGFFCIDSMARHILKDAMTLIQEECLPTCCIRS